MSTAEVTSVPKKVAGAKKAMTKKPHVAPDHPKYSEMIKQALMTLKERGGSSRQAVLKYIMANFNVGKDESVVNSHLKMALRAGVKNSTLKQSKGTGATGSFRLGAEASKKTSSGKKAKKSPSKKQTEKKSPKKVKAVKKSGKKSGPKSPKKVVKKAATPSKKAVKAVKPAAPVAAAPKAVKPKSAPKKAVKKAPTKAKKATQPKKA